MSQERGSGGKRKQKQVEKPEVLGIKTLIKEMAAVKDESREVQAGQLRMKEIAKQAKNINQCVKVIREEPKKRDEKLEEGIRRMKGKTEKVEQETKEIKRENRLNEQGIKNLKRMLEELAKRGRWKK